jgi:cytochrome P450
LPAAKAIPGPGLIESTRRLYPFPFQALPQFLADLTERYGDIAQFRLPGRLLVLANHPQQIKDVLVTQQDAFVKSPGVRTMRLIVGDGLLTSEDPHHRTMRRIVQPAFHHRRIESYARIMREFAQRWAERRTDGERFDLHEEMSELTFRVASRTLFGTDSGAQADDVRDALYALLEGYSKAVGPIGAAMNAFVLLPGAREIDAASKKLDAILDALIDERRRHPAERYDALSLLLSAEDPVTGDRLTDDELRDEARTLILAGHATTANAMVWSWILLARNPAVEERLHAEAAAANEGDPPFAHLAALAYARNVMRESMRIYPPAWLIGRQANRAVELAGGYHLPRGTTVFVCPLTLHRREALYREPQRFDPDRWLGEEVPPFAYVPFGGGARRCLGEEFAWTEGTLLLAAIARRMRFELECNPTEIDALVTMRPKGPVPVRVVRR